MLDWLRRKQFERLIGKTPIGKMLDQIAIAVAVSEITSEYFRSGRTRPICSDNNASVMEIWSGTRLEAISRLWNFGAADLQLIIDPTKHPALVNSLVERSISHLAPADATGRPLEDTVSAVLRVYEYISLLEEQVASPYRQITESNPTYVSKYASLIEGMRNLHLKWQGFRYAIDTKAQIPTQPDTVFITVWRDITRRSKIVALASKFGPQYMATIHMMRENITQAKLDPKDLDELIVRIFAADDPDDVGRGPMT
ncbi:MAG: hypothetical protein AB7K64_03270 [Variibacter sp.]